MSTDRLEANSVRHSDHIRELNDLKKRIFQLEKKEIAKEEIVKYLVENARALIVAAEALIEMGSSLIEEKPSGRS